ncbi:unnamed protein product [Caenorhabditis auriculariae]|uniref:Transmembrane protein 245 n=1 Tax=Caenorhabditis auriculariae TaxID=2777116 RepID=A0A8S1GPU7_9PELO|nr:unnamed protein product [Caenorhabditis auriculariae]
MAASGGGTALMDRYFTSENQDQRVAMQFAFYNVLLFVLLGVSLCGLFALYNMLYMFLTPMLWAVLVGTVLFPFKKRVTEIMQNWLKGLQSKNTTLVRGIINLPVNWFCRTSECLYTTAASSDGIYIAGAYVVLKFLSYERTFMHAISFAGRIYNGVDAFILLSAKPWVFPLIVIYSAAYAGWIYVQMPKPINKKLLRTLSLPIWYYVISYASSFFGPFRAAAFGISTVVLALLSAGVVAVDNNGSFKSDSDADDNEKEKNEVEKTAPVAEPMFKFETITDENGDSVAAIRAPSMESLVLDEAITGDRLIRIVFSLCALLWVVRHDSALILLAIPLFIAVVARIANNVGLTDALTNALDSLWQRFSPAVNKLVEITVAGPLREFVKVLFTSDQMITTSLHDKMDMLSSVVVMALLACSVLFGFVFIGFQLHGETVHLVRLTSNVVSSRPDWLGAAMNYTEDQLEDHDIDIDAYVQQAYEQGRAWLASNVRNLSNGKDSKRADMLENQVKQIVDNLYHLWEQRNVVTKNASTTDIARAGWMTQLKSVTDLAALKEELTLIVKDNLDTLMGVAQSVGAILAANLTFFSSILAAFAGIILGFGLDIVNLLIEIIVFLTMVYYLLSASRTRWLPLQWASDLSAVTSMAELNPGVADKHHITAAIEHAIFGVFVLSAKMSVFYGLYTYFVHSLFDLNIVFVPSFIASLFAAIPIMPPYIVAIFGVFELWLVRGEGAAALVFALASVSPIMYVDKTFYTEVKGSHPYVTGLSIIGGMYWLGLQGAIIGPIVLCLFLVLVNVYLQFVKPTATSTTPRALTPAPSHPILKKIE